MDEKINETAKPAAWRWAWKTTGSPLERRFADPDLYMWTYRDNEPAGEVTKKMDIEPLYSEADYLSLLSELSRLRSENEAMRKALGEAQEVLSGRASSSYCRSLDKFSETLCLGWEAKVKSGSYGLCEHEAHAEANRLMGRHIAFVEAVKLLAASLPEGRKP